MYQTAQTEDTTIAPITPEAGRRKAPPSQYIQVVKAPPLSWYANQIGKQFKVIHNSSSLLRADEWYKVMAAVNPESKGRYPGRYIRKRDAKKVKP